MSDTLKGRGTPPVSELSLSLRDRLDLSILLMNTGLTDDAVSKKLYTDNYKKFKSLVKMLPARDALAVIDDYLNLKSICTKVKEILKAEKDSLEK